MIHPTRPRVGFLYDGDAPLFSYRSFEAIIRAALSDRFEVIEIDARTPATAADAAWEGPRDASALVLDIDSALSPALLDRRNRERPDMPALVFAHAAMPKGGPTLHDLAPRMTARDALIFNSTADRRIFSRLADGARLRAPIIGWPVDARRFRPLPPEARAEIRARHGIAPDAELLLYIGRLNVQKNVHGLIDAFAAVRRVRPRCRLVLCGAPDAVVCREYGVGNDGYGPFLRRRAARVGGDGAVTFLGDLAPADVAALAASADVVVNLSVYNRENFGLAAVEAMAAGAPVVCADWGGFRDTVAHNRTGLRVPTFIGDDGAGVDSRLAARAIARLLADAPLRARMGAAGRLRATRRFSPARFTARLGAILTERVASRADASPGSGFTPSALAVAYLPHAPASGVRGGPTPLPPSLSSPEAVALYRRLIAPYATTPASRARAGASVFATLAREPRG